MRNDDGSFENAYAWSGGGVIPPEYGAFAECYTGDFVCGVQFGFTQIGYYENYTMDVYVWDSNVEGNPPPGPDPGNVLCRLAGVDPGAPAYWPEVSTHDVQVCCAVDGEHFVGFWGDWPGELESWYIAADENGPELGCPRTKIRPEMGYPTGWNHPNIIALFSQCKNLGIREYSGLGDCSPTATQATTWGRIKSFY
ncbi:MAG: hypothetical protein GF355_08835 [Candidatus Eisenbacteria bacterium]|nr:hypothetical protein [Candidatus Eisenbacteria bacterium]